MRNILGAGALSVAVLGLAASANAATMADMVGKWKWTDYTVECKAGGDKGMSCTVIDGPKNKGMEMIQSKLEDKGGTYVGDIKHPATGDIYHTKIQLKDADNWALQGCTATNVCADGVFTRVK